jgi:hypothetical protein
VLVPDFYELTVDDDPAFGSPNFQMTTSGTGAAPTQAAPFGGLQSGQLYYWRVRAYQGGIQFSADATSVFRYDASAAQPPVVSDPLPLFPRDAFEAVGAPPVLGWQPIAGAAGYRVQISLSPDFSEIVDEAVARSIFYVLAEGRTDASRECHDADAAQAGRAPRAASTSPRIYRWQPVTSRAGCRAACWAHRKYNTAGAAARAARR